MRFLTETCRTLPKVTPQHADFGEVPRDGLLRFQIGTVSTLPRQSNPRYPISEPPAKVGPVIEAGEIREIQHMRDTQLLRALLLAASVDCRTVSRREGKKVQEPFLKALRGGSAESLFFNNRCGSTGPVASPRPSAPIHRELLGIELIETSFLVGIGVNLDPFLYPEQR